MRRTVTCVVVAIASVLAAVVLTSPSASAAAPITGRLVDRTTQGTPVLKVVPGAVVRLRSVNGDGSAGPVVTTTTTDTHGAFTLPVPDGGAQYYIRIAATTDYQGGWVARRAGDSSNNLETGLDATSPDYRYVAGANLGDVSTMPAYFTGKVVNSKTLRPVANARVTGRDANDGMAVEGADTTGSKGTFRVNGLTCEDSCYLKVNGSAIGYETGFLTGQRIVPTWGQATAVTPGPVGTVKLDRL